MTPDQRAVIEAEFKSVLGVSSVEIETVEHVWIHVNGDDCPRLDDSDEIYTVEKRLIGMFPDMSFDCVVIPDITDDRP